MSEGFPAATTAVNTMEAIVPDVVYDEAYFVENFGLSLADTEQQVAYEEYSGTLSQMLTDPRCPVGGTIRRAFQEGGQEAVERKFEAIGELDSKFVVVFSRDEPDNPIKAAAENNNREPDSVDLTPATDKKKLLIPITNP